MIRLLEKNVADKIAAGEVVDRPLSVVKELVENAIDAHASSITIELKKGGKEYIRVSDNGCGIPSEEVSVAFLRHATSKIAAAKDLEHIKTLGFRGEALASICAVSRTSLITKTKEENTGTKIEIDGSQIRNISPIGCDEGTTVVVRDLFFNTPARLKFLKSDQAESTQVIDFVSQIALCYPKIRIKMVNNDSILFSTPGKGDRLNAIATIYGRTIAKALVPCEEKKEDYAISGFVSGTGESRNSKKNQVFFVNGRVVRSAVLDRAIKMAYQERLFQGRFPIVFLFLEIPADTLDVNIHPNKREVRFDDDRLVEEFTCEAVKKSLAGKDAAPAVTSEKLMKYAKSAHNTKNSEPLFDHNIRSEQVIVNKPITEDEKQMNLKEILSELREEKKLKEQPIFVEKKIDRPFDFCDLLVKGTLFDTYIVAQDSQNVYLIDQHAAHERVFYEKFQKQFHSRTHAGQQILTPFLVDIPVSCQGVTFLEYLHNAGYGLEEFGNRTYKVTEIPNFMSLSEAETFLHDFLSSLADEEKFSSSLIKDEIAKKACKAAVKGNMRLSDEEIQALFKELSICDNPYSCPHGRPTYIRMSKTQIERMFKRV